MGFKDITWIRHFEQLTFDMPQVFYVIGIRGAAKSTLLESIAEYHLSEDNKILDCYSSRDGENLAWCRSPWAEDKRILLLYGENVDVIAPFKTKKVNDFHLSDFNNYDIVISCPLFYLRPEDEFLAIGELIDKLYRRGTGWKEIIYLLCRESANLFYSRLAISKTQLPAKSSMAYLTRELRHQGVSLGMDTQSNTAVDFQIRMQSDFTFFKALGVMGISHDDPLHFLYNYYDWNWLRRMPKSEFAIVSRGGALGFGSFEYLDWHKRPKENLLSKLGVTVQYGEAKEPIKGSTESEVGDEEHSRIMEAYIKEKLSMGKISEKMGRSPATVLKHINNHNEAIERSGFCPRCKKTNSIYFLQRAVKS